MINVCIIVRLSKCICKYIRRSYSALFINEELVSIALRYIEIAQFYLPARFTPARAESHLVRPNLHPQCSVAVMHSAHIHSHSLHFANSEGTGRNPEYKVPLLRALNPAPPCALWWTCIGAQATTNGAIAMQSNLNAYQVHMHYVTMFRFADNRHEIVVE